MPLGRAKQAGWLVLLCLACMAPQVLAGKPLGMKDKAPAANDQQRALHALNRLTFGPRPGDLQQIMAMGVDQWIEQQLHPEKIDDKALNARLEPLRTLRMSSREIAENFPDPQEINQIMNGRMKMPSDPERHMIYEVQLTRLENRKERRQEAASAAKPQPSMMADNPPESADAPAGGAMNGAASGAVENAPPAAPHQETAAEKEQAKKREDEMYADLDIQQLPSLPPDQRYQKVLAMPLDQVMLFADSLHNGGYGQKFTDGLAPRQKETILALNNPPGVATNELAEAKLLRAVYSQRQLEEVMTDFWINHFNVFADKGLDRIMLTSYERDVIRPHALGKFEDLLVATAKSPAMLFYLDNWQSMGPYSPQALGIPPHPGPRWRPRPNANNRPSGLNENYGRELLELHTVSVNGGYSQHDVTEAAKVFTGWTIEEPAKGGGFKFEPRMHEPGPKTVMGHRIKPKGEGEGMELLHLLANQPQTAHFISLKLAQRFVSDDPPPALVDRMAKTFLKKKGDIREVLSTLFHSPEFWDEGTYRAKVKTPLEFVASSLRATGAEIDDATPLTRQLANMGMPLYGAQPPTGYSMKAETWVSSSALLNRMNFAMALANGKIRGVKLDAARFAASGPAAADADAMLSSLETNLVAGGVSKQTHDSITAQIQSAAPKSDNSAPQKAPANGQESTISGLLLGSPEFQRR
ncbi:MAG TPA: DUF1800 domain-containing protein [Candidatus Binatia bacterium]|nr:DUF1800 domain-containing protein [Candidatus Binatia bacterium]